MDISLNKLRGLDLFSGIGGISEALVPWVETVAYCENDKFPQAVLLSRMERGEIDTAPIWDDVTTLSKKVLNEAGLKEIDIITGGWPCQGNSVAGKRLGMEDLRSGLVREVTRLVGELRPELVFLENVAGVLSAPGDGLGYILNEMASMGYDCRWGVSPIEEAPHRRQRLFLLAHAPGKRWHEILHTLPPGSTKTHNRWEAIALATPRDTVNEFILRTGEPPLFGVADLRWDPYSPERLKCHGNQVAPSQAQTAFKRLIGLEKLI